MTRTTNAVAATWADRAEAVHSLPAEQTTQHVAGFGTHVAAADTGLVRSNRDAMRRAHRAHAH